MKWKVTLKGGMYNPDVELADDTIWMVKDVWLWMFNM